MFYCPIHPLKSNSSNLWLGVYSEYSPVPLTTSHLHLSVCHKIVRLLVRFQILYKLFGKEMHISGTFPVLNNKEYC